MLRADSRQSELLTQTQKHSAFHLRAAGFVCSYSAFQQSQLLITENWICITLDCSWTSEKVLWELKKKGLLIHVALGYRDAIV